jgi:hypothetical protein
MSRADRPERGPDVKAEPAYRDAGVGPSTDSHSFDKRTPLGAIRSPPEPRVTAHEAVVADTSSVPRLSRAALRRAGGSARVAEEPAEGSSNAVRVVTAVLAVVACVGLAAFVGLGMGNAQTEIGEALEVAETEPPPKSLSGIEVREGMRGRSDP